MMRKINTKDLSPGNNFDGSPYRNDLMQKEEVKDQFAGLLNKFSVFKIPAGKLRTLKS